MVCTDEVVVRRVGDDGRAPDGLSDDVGHLEEATLVLEEPTVHDLVGGVEDTGHIATTLDGLESQRQTTELVQIGLKELQRVMEQIETLT